jgi:predicted kinase
MEAVIFCGIQGTGKTTFFIEKFVRTHVRISLDLLKTRHRELRFVTTCLETGQRFVVDNTNPTKAERLVYIKIARENKFAVVGYYFSSNIQDALARNAQRSNKERVPDIAVKGTLAKLERPSMSEGFDVLYYVTIVDGKFNISEWNDEL